MTQEPDCHRDKAVGSWERKIHLAEHRQDQTGWSLESFCATSGAGREKVLRPFSLGNDGIRVEIEVLSGNLLGE